MSLSGFGQASTRVFSCCSLAVHRAKPVLNLHHFSLFILCSTGFHARVRASVLSVFHARVRRPLYPLFTIEAMAPTLVLVPILVLVPTRSPAIQSPANDQNLAVPNLHCLAVPNLGKTNHRLWAV